MTKCFFCQEELSGKRNIHHVIPVRYYRSKQEANLGNNQQKAHIDCHCKWHREYDRNPTVPLDAYIARFDPMNYGQGIYRAV